MRWSPVLISMQLIMITVMVNLDCQFDWVWGKLRDMEVCESISWKN